MPTSSFYKLAIAALAFLLGAWLFHSRTVSCVQAQAQTECYVATR
jgi:hypothetical protein